MGTTITGENINKFRMIVLLKGLKLELRGMKMSRGRSCYSMIKQEFGLKGNKQRVYEQFEKLVQELTEVA